MVLFHRTLSDFAWFRALLSTSGIGYSSGGRGFRVGRVSRTPSYSAPSLPGTGVGYRKSAVGCPVLLTSCHQASFVSSCCLETEH